MNPSLSPSLRIELNQETPNPNDVERRNLEVERRNFIDSLRAVADFYESHPNLPAPLSAWDQGELLRYGAKDPAEFATCARELGVAFTLIGDDKTLVGLDRKFGCITVGYRGHVERVLVRRETGTAPVYTWALDGGAQ